MQRFPLLIVAEPEPELKPHIAIVLGKTESPCVTHFHVNQG